MKFVFGEFELEPELRVLRHRGEAIEIQRKALELLILLVQRRGRYVSREDALRTVWPDVFVSEHAFSQTLHKLRQVLGRESGGAALLESRRGHGVRFAPEGVRVILGNGGADASRPAASGAQGPVPGLLEREEALARIDAALGEAAEGRGQVVLVSGEAGIGKSSVAAAAAERAPLRGFQSLSGRASSHEGGPPFALWTRMLVDMVRSSRAQDLEHLLGERASYLVQTVPELREALDGAAASVLAEPEHSRFHCFQAALSLLRQHAERQPVLLILDDLHRADSSSLLLTQFLSRRLQSVAVALLVTYRSEELDPGSSLEATVADLYRVPGVREVRLRGLSPDAVLRLASSLTGVPVDPSVGIALHRRTGGNPFFLRECVALLPREGGAARPDDLSELVGALPPAARDVAGRRLERLSAPARRFLELAALLAEEPSVPVVGRAGDFADAEAFEALEEAIRGGLIEETAGRGRFRFRHEIIREAIAAALGPEVRSALHERLARSLEACHADELDAHAEALAYHAAEAVRSGTPDADALARSLAWSERAGQKALDSFHYEDAVRYFGDALAWLDALPEVPPQRRTELLLARGNAYLGAAAFADARESFRAALERARADGDRVRFARAALGFATRPVWPDWLEPVHALEEALASLPHEPALASQSREQSELLARLRMQLAIWLTFDLSQRERALALSRGSMEGAEGSPALLAEARISESSVLAIAGSPDRPRRLALANESLALAESAGDRVRAMIALHRGLRPIAEMGRFAEADARFARFEAASRALQLVDWTWPAPLYRGMRHAMRGAFAAAAAEITTVTRVTEEIGRLDRPDTMRVPSVQAALWVVQRDLGVPIEAANTAFTARWFSNAPLVRAGLTLLLAETGQVGPARAALRDLAQGDFAAVRSWSDPVGTAGALAEACGVLDEPEPARGLVALLAPHDGCWIVLMECAACSGTVAHYLGVAESVMEEWDAAEAHFRAALELAATEDAHPWMARTSLWWARLLRRRGRAADRPRLRELLARARSLAAPLEMRGLLEEIDGADAPARRGARR